MWFKKNHPAKRENKLSQNASTKEVSKAYLNIFVREGGMGEGILSFETHHPFWNRVVVSAGRGVRIECMTQYGKSPINPMTGDGTSVRIIEKTGESFRLDISETDGEWREASIDLIYKYIEYQHSKTNRDLIDIFNRITS